MHYATTLTSGSNNEPGIASDWQRQQLARHMSRLILREVASAQLTRSPRVNAVDLIFRMRLHRKRPSIAKKVLNWSLASLHESGAIQMALEVA
jgi:hypothetical protein